MYAASFETQNVSPSAKNPLKNMFSADEMFQTLLPDLQNALDVTAETTGGVFERLYFRQWCLPAGQIFKTHLYGGFKLLGSNSSLVL